MGEDLAGSWRRRVRANRDQVERVAEAPHPADFYAPVTSVFVEDPRRQGDEALDALLTLARGDETWLDIGAGAGRYALPLALAVRSVIAIEPSPAMVAALRDGMQGHRIENVEVIAASWPISEPVTADVALIAHVGYDIEEIGTFLDAMESAARRCCVAVLMDRSPASAADGFWPAVHGVRREPLPGLPEFLELLRSRGAGPEVRTLPRSPRSFPERDELMTYLRRQLWVLEGSAADRRLAAEVDRRVQRVEEGLLLPEGPTRIGVVSWSAGDL